jgi:hypothetical protein
MKKKYNLLDIFRAFRASGVKLEGSRQGVGTGVHKGEARHATSDRGKQQCA